MTREDENTEVVRKLVVVFDICSSTTILEDLKRTDQLDAWRNLLIAFKTYVIDSAKGLKMELYKFVGDGWILLFPDKIAKDKLCKFLRSLSEWFETNFEARIADLLEHRPDPTGLTFGIDSGDLIRLEMNEQWEYIGRAINVAARLQGQAKEVPGGPAYQALFSRSSFNSAPRAPRNLPVKSVTVSLRNISHGDKYDCLVFRTYENRAASGKTSRQGKTNLEIIFEDSRKPYLEEQPINVIPAGTVMDRRYRVGIRNNTRVVVPNVQLVLENCEPSNHHGIHLGHTLRVMGHRDSSDISVPPGDGATAFFDVVYDQMIDGKLHGNAFGLCYAAPVRSFAIPRGSYVVTLRAEGNGVTSRKRFRIFQESETNFLTMREVRS